MVQPCATCNAELELRHLPRKLDRCLLLEHTHTNTPWTAQKCQLHLAVILQLRMKMWCAMNWSNSIDRAKSWAADHGFSWISTYVAGLGSRGWLSVLFFGDWNICISRNGLNISFDWLWGTYYDVLKFIEPRTARVRNKAPRANGKGAGSGVYWAREIDSDNSSFFRLYSK